MSPAAGTDAYAPYSAAVALVARQLHGLNVPRDELTEGIPAGDVLRAMEVIMAGVLANGWPDDSGAHVLEQIGQYFAAGVTS